MALVDAVVVSYNSRGELRECIEPLSRIDWVDPFVVDNASSDDSLAAVAGLRVRTVQNEENVGFARGSNIGWRKGSAPYVLFLNPDASIDEASLRRLADTLEHDEQAGIAAPRILDDDGGLHFSLRRFARLRSTYAQALFLHRLFPRAPWTDEVVREPEAYLRPGEQEWVSGACMLVRRTLLEQLGGFDEGFFLYCEDMDLCLRVREAGYRVEYVPDATALHEGGASAPAPAVIPLLAESRARFARKHLDPLRDGLERGGIALGELTHALVGRGGPAVRAAHRRSAAIALRSRRT
jgi:N-acetylglucosaminyl-diphospho-decaprenol L-rhamnosyltransferase